MTALNEDRPILWTMPEWEMFPPLTGGQLICWKHYSHLRARGLPIRIVDRRQAPWVAVRSRMARNLWYFRQAQRVEARLVVENAVQRNDFLLANCLLRALRRTTRILVLALEPHDGPVSSRWRARRRRLLFAWYFRQADAVVVLSEATKKWIVSHGVAPEKIHVIPPAARDFPVEVGGDGAKDDDPRERDGQPCIVCVSHIRRDKGQRYLLEAMKLLRDRPWDLLLVGTVKELAYREDLQRTISRAGLDGRVCFTGPLEGTALRAAYRRATIFVLPTLRDAYGMAIVEAMGEGAPVVASRVGGIPEIIRDGVDGLLVPPRHPRALANAIERLLGDADLRREMARQARKRALCLPTWEQACNRFYQTVTHLIEEGECSSAAEDTC